MSGKGTTDAMFALRILMEKYRKGQRELHCVFVDLKKAYDKVPREELWHCKRKSGMVECATCTGYVRGKRNSVEVCSRNYRKFQGQGRTAPGISKVSTKKSPFLLTVIMDRLMDEVRREPPWTMLFADNIMICEDTRKEVEQRLECWRYALERRGMKISR